MTCFTVFMDVLVSSIKILIFGAHVLFLILCKVKPYKYFVPPLLMNLKPEEENKSKRLS